MKKLAVIFLVLVVQAVKAESQNGSMDSSASNQSKLMHQVRAAYSEVCPECRFEFSDIRIRPQNLDLSQDIQLKTSSAGWSQGFIFAMEKDDQALGWLTGQVKIYRKGLMLQTPVDAGQEITEKMVTEDWIFATHLRDGLATREDLKGMMAKKFLSLRQPILKSDLKKIQIVQRGQMLTVRTGSDQFELTTSMKAEDSGGVGDILKVKSLDGLRFLTVKVNADGSGRIE